MVKRGNRNIVTISSVNSFLPDPGIIDYCAAKAALTNFSKALSKEVGPAGIRMNTVSPGPVETALWLGPDGVAATVAKASGIDQETARKQVVASQDCSCRTRQAARNVVLPQPGALRSADSFGKGT
jgi:NAD(P)-dependent dehydrogenase (short-subunit alcohol dehydrogenase family)